MSLGKNKLLDYLTDVQCLDKTVVSWIQRTGFDNVAAFVQTFSLPTMDLVGVSNEFYLPDKSILGKRTEGITMFEKAVISIASLDELKKYSGRLLTCVSDFQLLPGHIIGLQLTATELRHRKQRIKSYDGLLLPMQNIFVPEQNAELLHEERQERSSLCDMKVDVSYFSQPEETPNEPVNDITEARKSILFKIKRKLNEKNKNIDINPEAIIFKETGAYVCCPSCQRLCKILSRAHNKNGTKRYETDNVTRHIIACTTGQSITFVSTNSKKRRFDTDDSSSQFEDSSSELGKR